MNILIFSIFAILISNDMHSDKVHINNAKLVEFNFGTSADKDRFGLVVTQSNDLKLPPKAFEEINASLTSAKVIDEFLSKGSSPTECLVVYVFLNQKYPERGIPILPKSFRLTIEGEFNFAWIGIATADGVVQVPMTTTAFGELLKAHWRDYLVENLD